MAARKPRRVKWKIDYLGEMRKVENDDGTVTVFAGPSQLTGKGGVRANFGNPDPEVPWFTVTAEEYAAIDAHGYTLEQLIAKSPIEAA